MAVVFNEVVGQWITSDSFTGGDTIRNIHIVLNLGSPTYRNNCLVIGNGALDEITSLNLNWDGTAYAAGVISWGYFFSGTDSQWRSSTDILISGLNDIFITYDGSNTTNVPVLYHNGIEVAVTLLTTPTGTIGTNPSITCTIGGAGGTRSPNGSVIAFEYITGRVVSASEVLDSYNSKLMKPNIRSVAISPNLLGAAGLQTFDGTTLGTTNYIYDYINGIKFTPASSPVGAADTYLNWK